MRHGGPLRVTTCHAYQALSYGRNCGQAGPIGTLKGRNCGLWGPYVFFRLMGLSLRGELEGRNCGLWVPYATLMMTMFDMMVPCTTELYGQWQRHGVGVMLGRCCARWSQTVRVCLDLVSCGVPSCTSSCIASCIASCISCIACSIIIIIITIISLVILAITTNIIINIIIIIWRNDGLCGPSPNDWTLPRLTPKESTRWPSWQHQLSRNCGLAGCCVTCFLDTIHDYLVIPFLKLGHFCLKPFVRPHQAIVEVQDRISHHLDVNHGARTSRTWPRPASTRISHHFRCIRPSPLGDDVGLDSKKSSPKFMDDINLLSGNDAKERTLPAHMPDYRACMVLLLVWCRPGAQLENHSKIYLESVLLQQRVTGQVV